MCSCRKVTRCFSLLNTVPRCRKMCHHPRRYVSSSVHGKSPEEYCMTAVKNYDYENFLSTLLLPNAARSAMFAVRAYNVEIAQIFDVVSDPQIGKMRMQFWKDSLNLIVKNEPPQTPVAVALARAVDIHNLSKTWLSRMLESRVAMIGGKPFHELADVETYAENSVSSVNYLALQCLGVKDVTADHVASHLGKAQGIVTLLRGVPYHAQRGQCYIPMHSMLQHGVSQEDILRGKTEQKVKDVAYDIASAAHQHLETARSLKDKVPKAAKLAFISTAAFESYLKALQKADFNLFDGRLQQRNHWLPLQLWLHKRGQYY